MPNNYYDDYISKRLKSYLHDQLRPVPGISDLTHVGEMGGLETPQSLRFLCELFEKVEVHLNTVLEQRKTDRDFLDQRTQACFELNKKLSVDFLDPRYQTVLGMEDSKGRIVAGPLNDGYYCFRSQNPVAPLPDFLKGTHVTLFGPPDDPKLSVNAMNAFHRRLKDEPPIVDEILKKSSSIPKWGADDEDSKTPLRKDLISAGVNLTECFDGTIRFTDSKKSYSLEKDHLSLPIKRFPGLALPCSFLFYKNEPLPLHLYDFALHLFKNWHNPKALSFYVPKLETSEEAAYIHNVMSTAEDIISKIHPDYIKGNIRLFIVLENPRAIFRVHEIMDELYPYFAGASLGWHDYLASTARLFKNDSNYRIPVKADPDIVIKYIKASHDLLAQVVGPRGGIKIGGMYGILPLDNDLKSASFQMTIKGFIKDVMTQMKRDLSGFWVAHPDFVRIGIALTEAWKTYKNGNFNDLENLVKGLLLPEYHQEIINFIKGDDIAGLDKSNKLFPRSLIVADIRESNFIPNNHPDEIRYNVFQALQYITDWLRGNGCVALPAQVQGVPVRVMDDLATAERSRWEVWHEIHHGRFSVEEFLKIAHEEMLFIRKDLSNSKKIVQVKWDQETSKWYPLAMKLMIKLMTDRNPVEFATELLLPFTLDKIRQAEDPWAESTKIDPIKYKIDPYLERFNYYFSVCGSFEFAKQMAKNFSLDLIQAENLIKSFSLAQVIESASFHGDIGESKKTLDEVASKEQSLVLNEDKKIKDELQILGKQYHEKFGFKFLISAKGKSGKEILEELKKRIDNSANEELENAKLALWEISRKRFEEQTPYSLHHFILDLKKKHRIHDVQVSISADLKSRQSICLNHDGLFELASLSKTIASYFAIEYFKSKKIPLNTKVNSLFAKTKSTFKLKGEWGDQVTLIDLMSHTALNLHYVNGVPLTEKMPPLTEFLEGNSTYQYDPIQVINKPGTTFQYSGGGFLVLEHLLEALEEKSIQDLTQNLGFSNLTFEQKNISGKTYASGFLSDGTEVTGTRKMFPAFAAGAMGTASDMHEFLIKLTKAYQNSDHTAITMLHGLDKGSQEFMNAKMGLGVFTLEAGANRFMLHQGANDGFRCLFLHCFEGPDLGKGFVILCNGDINGVFFIAELAQKILKELQVSGINYSLFQTNFNFSGIPSEQVVNKGYKELFLDAFENDMPEKIEKIGPLDPLSPYNLAANAKIIKASNQKFARAENLVSSHLPVFDPELFGTQGKIMDSWETVRHNQAEYDYCILELKKPSEISSIYLSTQFHLGNQAPFVQLEGRTSDSESWEVFLPKTALQGHSAFKTKLDKKTKAYKQIRVLIYPDGGLTRLGLYDDTLPEKFTQTISEKFPDAIPQTHKPLAPTYRISDEIIKENWSVLRKGSEVDIACSAYGARVLSATNEHYSPASQVISPFPPLNMFDGSESARSREKNHSESIVIGFAKNAPVHRIEIDFSFFKNNNPFEMSLESGSKIILPKTPVKAYAGKVYKLDLEEAIEMDEIKITVIPDGGINRVRVYSYV